MAKLYAYWITVNYREAYGMYACNGILFNHESPRRGETFVTRKITRALANIAHGLEGKLFLGNLDALRDWGHARDYVEMQWLMLQQDQPEDFVIATGRQYSVRHFVEVAAGELGIEIAWHGHGIGETGTVAAIRGDRAGRCGSGRRSSRSTRSISGRPKSTTLLGDASRARDKLGWAPRTTFEEMVQEMVAHDLDKARRHALLKSHGHNVAHFLE